MSTTELAKATPLQAETLSRVLLDGNLAQLNAAQKVEYMTRVCESLGLNPLTKPFEFLSLNGKLVMYAKRDCTEQLRKIHGVSVTIVSREVTEGIYVVTARAEDREGRHDESLGAVAIEGLKGEARSNALMKAETKAKRRVTLSICGLGMLDESEASSLPGCASPGVAESPERIAGNDAQAPVASSRPVPANRAATVGPEALDADVLDPPGGAPPPSKPRTAADVKPTGGPITPDQVKMIHTLKGKVGGLTDEAYRKGVAVYRQADGNRCVGDDGFGSSKLLSKDQASHLINRFEDKIRSQAARAGTGVDITATVKPKDNPPALMDMLETVGDHDSQANWLHAHFGHEYVKELDKTEAETALQLLLAMSEGADAYDAAETKAREEGRIR